MRKIIDNTELTRKILVALDKWAMLYTMRAGGEFFGTPRYSQLCHEIEFDGKSMEQVFYLESTQNGFTIIIEDLTKDEENYLIGIILSHTVWDQYKELRNEYLAEHYPMISLR